MDKKLKIFERLISNYKKFNDLDSKEYDKNCLMLEVSCNQYIKRLQEQIPFSELYEGKKGFETMQHITIIYGILPHITINNFAISLPRIEDYGMIECDGISIFECDDFDVLKLDVKNNLLTAAFNYMNENVPNENEHQEYHGHVTVAYLKKGCGKKYINDNVSFIFKPTNYRYSSRGIVETFR